MYYFTYFLCSSSSSSENWDSTCKAKVTSPSLLQQNEDERERGPRDKFVPASHYISVYSLISQNSGPITVKLKLVDVIKKKTNHQPQNVSSLELALTQHHLVEHLPLPVSRQLVFVNLAAEQNVQLFQSECCT